MSSLATLVADTVTALTANGVPATADPDMLGSLISAGGVAALVMPPDVESRVLARGMRCILEVHVLGAAPGGYTQLGPVWEQLGPAMDALTCRRATRTTTTVGGVTYPGYQLTSTTNTPC